MTDFPNENVLKDTCEVFAETISLKVQQFRKFVPKAREKTNTDLTGKYIEELVRGFIRHWIGNRLLLHGTFYSQKHCESQERPLQIDGIVYDPTKGPVILREGDFVIVHPAFCCGVIEIKMTTNSISDFEEHLQEIHCRYMNHSTTTHSMGIVIADKNHESILTQNLNSRIVGHCPVFILFEEKDNEYVPYKPAIEAMIRSIYNDLYISGNPLE